MGFDGKFTTESTTGMMTGAPAVAIVASARHAGQIARETQSVLRLLVSVHPVAAEGSVPEALLDGASAIVIEVDRDESRSLDRLSSLVRSRPDIPVIAALVEPDMRLVRTLVREGVADVISLPLDADELTQSVFDVLARRAAAARTPRLAPLVGVVGTAGGAGATTFACHLAAAIGRTAGHGGDRRSVIAVDGDLQCGSLAAYLDVTRSGSLLDMAQAAARLDAELLHSIATETSEGIAVLGAARQIDPLESMDGNALYDAMGQLRRRYDAVVMDFPPCWSNWSASLAHSATQMLVVTEVSLGGLRLARRIIDLFQTLGIPDSRVAIVASKVERRAFRPIALGDLTRVTGKEPIAILPDESDLLHRAQEHGVLAEGVARKNPYSRAVATLAETLEGVLFGEGQQ